MRSVPEWAMPVRGVGFWSGLLRVAVGSFGGVALVAWLGVLGVLALPLLVPLVWLIEDLAFGVSRLLGPDVGEPIVQDGSAARLDHDAWNAPDD